MSYHLSNHAYRILCLFIFLFVDPVPVLLLLDFRVEGPFVGGVLVGALDVPRVVDDAEAECTARVLVERDPHRLDGLVVEADVLEAQVVAQAAQADLVLLQFLSVLVVDHHQVDQVAQLMQPLS